jgi:hypothetical protein
METGGKSGTRVIRLDVPANGVQPWSMSANAWLQQLMRGPGARLCNRLKWHLTAPIEFHQAVASAKRLRALTIRIICLVSEDNMEEWRG